MFISCIVKNDESAFASEILDINSNHIPNLFLQILGALYLGFGMLNWMAKGSIIGGIYNRPIVIGNFMNFLVASFALIKAIKHFSNSARVLIIALTIGYVFFAVCFGYLFISTPSKVKNI